MFVLSFILKILGILVFLYFPLRFFFCLMCLLSVSSLLKKTKLGFTKLKSSFGVEIKKVCHFSKGEKTKESN